MNGTGIGSHRKTATARPAQWTVEGAALDVLAQRVEEHFEENKPEPTSFPETAARVMDVAEHPDVDVSKLAHLIERDPAMAAGVLGLANSALHRRSTPVHSIRSAITLLGLRHVANVAVAVACRTLFDVEARVQRDLYPQWWDRLFHSALTEAFAASFVAMERLGRTSDTIFLAGMFHDIGKPLALRSLSALLISGQLPGIPSNRAIDTVLLRTHLAIGVSAQQTWQFPEATIETCRRHADPVVPKGEEFVDTHIVRLVSGLNDVRLGSEACELRGILIDSSRALGLGRDDVLSVARQVSDSAGQVGALFSVSDGSEEAGFLDSVTSWVDA